MDEAWEMRREQLIPISIFKDVMRGFPRMFPRPILTILGAFTPRLYGKMLLLHVHVSVFCLTCALSTFKLCVGLRSWLGALKDLTSIVICFGNSYTVIDWLVLEYLGFDWSQRLRLMVVTVCQIIYVRWFLLSILKSVVYFVAQTISSSRRPYPSSDMAEDKQPPTPEFGEEVSTSSTYLCRSLSLSDQDLDSPPDVDYSNSYIMDSRSSSFSYWDQNKRPDSGKLEGSSSNSEFDRSTLAYLQAEMYLHKRHPRSSAG